jgi:hypothetical protein
MPDLRSAAQRRHDAMLDAAYRLLNSGTLPAAGGTPVTVMVKTTAADLTSEHGVATTGHGDLISIRQLMAMASEAAIVSLLCGQDGEVLNLGRTQRLATKQQRLALFARDGGCCFPGCDRPAAWSEAHHIIAWIRGGRTDLANLCLLCRFHHRHFEQHGWVVYTAPDGRPEWLPPPWIDPLRIPVRNIAHHIRDFDFASVEHDRPLTPV